MIKALALDLALSLGQATCYASHTRPYNSRGFPCQAMSGQLRMVEPRHKRKSLTSFLADLEQFGVYWILRPQR